MSGFPAGLYGLIIRMLEYSQVAVQFSACQRAEGALIAGVGDLERAVARLAGGQTGRDASGIVLYEDAAARKVTQLCAALRGLQTLHVCPLL